MHKTHLHLTPIVAF